MDVYKCDSVLFLPQISCKKNYDDVPATCTLLHYSGFKYLTVVLRIQCIKMFVTQRK